MAKLKIAGEAPKKKKARPADRTFDPDARYMGDEPAWDTDRALNMEQAEFDHHLRRSFNYYNYFFSSKDLKKDVIVFLEKNGILDKRQVSLFRQASDTDIPMQLCSIARANKMGMPVTVKIREYVDKALRQVFAVSDDVVHAPVTATKAAPKPTIQDRLNEKISFIIGDLHGQIDRVLQKKQPEFKVYDHLTANTVAQASVGKVTANIQKLKDELDAAEKTKDALVKEGYSNYTKADFKRAQDYLDSILLDIAAYTQVKKATKKARKPKIVSKEKVVAKLKYQKEDKILRLVSINPAEIIGATQLWVYDTKTRKLGTYYADSHTGTLGIKGSAVVGFDEATSVCKTLRKPDEKLKEFSKASKVALRTFLKDIRATDTKMKARLTATTILLKVL